MSNPAKTLKKLVKTVVVVSVVAAIAYVALPALSGAPAAAGGAAASTGSFTAGTTALAAGGGGTAATTAAAAGAGAKGAGLLAGLKAGAAKVGGAIAGADPIVKMGMIQAGSQMLAGAMTPEPQTEAEKLQDQLNVYHSQPVSVRDYSAITNHSSAQPQQPVPQAGLVAQQYQPVAPRNDGLLGRYNPQTRRWEPTQNA